MSKRVVSIVHNGMLCMSSMRDVIGLRRDPLISLHVTSRLPRVSTCRSDTDSYEDGGLREDLQR